MQGVGWVGAGDLAKGDEVYSSKGSWLKVASGTWLTGRETVYNFEVKGFHTYFVGTVGVWVHNSCFAKSAPKSAGRYDGLRSPKNTKPTTSQEFLPGELNTGTYDELIEAGTIGDNITPHHMPGATYMKEKFGISIGDSRALNMEQPRRGGRHRRTESYGRRAFLDEKPRNALARDVLDARKIYIEDSLYSPQVRQQLQKYINEYKSFFRQIYG